MPASRTPKPTNTEPREGRPGRPTGVCCRGGRVVRVAVGRAERRRERQSKVTALFVADTASVALDLIEIVEMAWHDSFGEVTPSEDLIDDMLLLSDGSVEKLIGAARMALADWRDLKVATQRRRDTN